VHSQKDMVPMNMRMTARPMKKGPAAPVILFPQRSRLLKQLNTRFAQIMTAKSSLSSQMHCFKGRWQWQELLLCHRSRVLATAKTFDKSFDAKLV